MSREGKTNSEEPGEKAGQKADEEEWEKAMHEMSQRATVLVVDDQQDSRLILEDMLSQKFDVVTAANGVEALEAMRNHPALVLLDVVMPVMDGLEVCRRLKSEASTRDTPVIFLTSLDSPTDEAFALSLGAEDFVHKPVSAPVVLARIQNHLALAQARLELKRHNEQLEMLVEQRTEQILKRERQLIASQDATIAAFCALAESRDNETGNHIRRTQHYVRCLAERARQHPRFAQELTDDVMLLIFKSAPLHDVGKVAVPDAILLKPGKLSPEEWEIMKTHAAAGRDAIARAAAELPEGNDFLHYAMEIAYCHHERWDGKGYPRGLREDAIPLSARLMAIADVYDALISRRVYKPAFSHEQAIATMAEERGRQFDPDILDTLLADHGTFREIAARYADEGQLEAAAP